MASYCHELCEQRDAGIERASGTDNGARREATDVAVVHSGIIGSRWRGQRSGV